MADDPAQTPATLSEPGETTNATTPAKDDAQKRAEERTARFKALQARQAQSRTQNRKETQAEAQRKSVDPAQLTALNRKHAIASHKLAKADAEAAGEDFERKRAWDWTVDEAERWDQRQAEKKRAREDVAFQDYTQHARKVFDRQMEAQGEPDLDAYEAEKAEAVRKAAAKGQLELIERDDGELVAIDRTGNFDRSQDVSAYPSKEKIDLLVQDLQKAEDSRQKKKRQRRGEQDDGDVTYINEKNKVFNQKLARFYNKYTSDIRENFERGTAM